MKIACKSRIAIFDSWNGKFSKEIVKHWEKNHEVKVNPTWEQAEYADIVFFYQADNVAVEGTKNHKFNGKVFVQCVDIEVWAGQANAVNWYDTDGAIFMAKHIRDMVVPSIRADLPIAIIQPGIDLTKYTLRPPNDFSDPIRRIAYVVGDNRIWDVKRFDIALQITKDLLNKTNIIWQLHVRGTYSSHAQYNAYCKHLQKDLELDDFVIWHDKVEDMNEWLDDKDYLFLASTKEAFSYATAEAMAKGIKPVLGNWQSAKEVWGPYANETYLDMFYEFLDPDYSPHNYRKYVEDRYDQERYFNELDAFMGIEG
jgi:glycosyltransferase involved in cell wall biosynthesis